MAKPEYFWIITYQVPDQVLGGNRILTSSGTIAVSPGATRSGLYNRILRSVAEELPPGYQPGNVMFFHLEPNQL